MLSFANDQGLIKGVPILETRDEVTHSQFSDNTSVTIVANLEMIENTLGIFRTLGEAFGLHIKERGIKAVYLGSSVAPGAAST